MARLQYGTSSVRHRFRLLALTAFLSFHGLISAELAALSIPRGMGFNRFLCAHACNASCRLCKRIAGFARQARRSSLQIRCGSGRTDGFVAV